MKGYIAMQRSIKINDNISLHHIPVSKLKTTTVSAFIHRPLSESEASYNALLPHVLNRGCALCPNMELSAKYLESLYDASFSAAGTRIGEDHIMYFVGETICDRFTPDNEPLTERLTALLLSVIFEPVIKDGAFDTEVVAQEKNNAINRINALINDKRSYASMRCQTEMCKGTPFAVSKLGTKEGIEGISAADLYAHYKRIINSSVIDFYVSGDTDIDAVADKIRAFTADIEFTEAAVPETAKLVKDAEVNYVTEHMDVTQGKLAIGFRTDSVVSDKDAAAMTVFNSVFGAGAHSKLFNNVREKLSLCYYASSQLEQFKGFCVVNAGIEFENYQKAFDETLVQLEDIKNGRISDLEFESSVKAIINSYNSYDDNQLAMQLYFLREKIGGTQLDIAERIDAIKAVTKADVANAAKKLVLDTVYFLAGKEND